MHGYKEKQNLAPNKLTIFLNDLVELIFPNTCLICKKELTRQESNCCTFCLNEFHYTHYEKFTEPTPMDQLFWGRVNLHSTFSLLHFEKGKGAQILLHELKYNNNQKLGVYLGKDIAKKLKNSTLLQGVDVLIPVPIHHRKRFSRGYNQSEELAKGISQITHIPINTKLIYKSTHVGSQTKKNRFLRWDNVSENFFLANDFPQHIQHVAIIDDVVTTGSTIEAMVATMHKNYPHLRVSVICLAITK